MGRPLINSIEESATVLERRHVGSNSLMGNHVWKRGDIGSNET